MAKKLKKTIFSIPVVYEADSKKGYVAFAPTLPGCHSQGETLEEAEANITEAIVLYLEVVGSQSMPGAKTARILQGMVQVSVKSYA